MNISLLRRGSFSGGRRKTQKMKNRGSAGDDGKGEAAGASAR